MTSLGRFEIIEEIGRGGMGVVFRAHDPEMERDVALKVLRLDAALAPAEAEEIGRRFEREAKAAGGLNHPSIVAHYERGESGAYKFIVMEFVEGRPLHKLMSDGPRLELPAALGILRQIASGLDYAHKRGVIHRDIKPANILLPVTGGAKIADFGIAKNLLSGSMTSASMVLGSPYYMSPEQIEGHDITGSADQWGLAVTAYELLAGRKPFDSDSIAALFQQILSTEPRDPREFDPSIPSAAREVFQRALSKAPGERYPSCAEFVEALADAATEPVAKVVPVAPTPPPPQRTNWPLWAGLPIAAVVLTSAILYWPATRPSHVSAAPASSVMHASAVAVVDPSLSPSLLKIGQTRVNRRDDLTYVWIAPGEFRMGCSPDDAACHGDETPHDVKLTKGFWLGQTEVTVAAYAHFALVSEATLPKPPDDNSKWAEKTKPISNVTWDGAAAYCNWTGGRLPTEAEWEFAARAGDAQSRYGALPQIAWFAGNSGAHAHAVKELKANAFGLFDMLGNVWEWTADFYGREYYGQSPASDPSGPTAGEYRVLRGGSWVRDPGDVRVSLRYPSLPNSPDQVVGFRCAVADLP